ncbi:hypothetical protein RRG08_010561 [Elysia crispata]|uniref:Uncharacterized protein n=1 Tax=Elysia crispata TaxID=231223 RepID=A0AAE1DMY9_9GAST|nr:hypothetical protein RRG08_010561 [Elysia crispata]
MGDRSVSGQCLKHCLKRPTGDRSVSGQCLKHCLKRPTGDRSVSGQCLKHCLKRLTGDRSVSADSRQLWQTLVEQGRKHNKKNLVPKHIRFLQDVRNQQTRSINVLLETSDLESQVSSGV